MRFTIMKKAAENVKICLPTTNFIQQKRSFAKLQFEHDHR